MHQPCHCHPRTGIDGLTPLLTLKIDVDTYRAPRIGVLNLARLQEKQQASASFRFSLGPITQAVRCGGLIAAAGGSLPNRANVR